jgi:hypothetical protein
VGSIQPYFALRRTGQWARLLYHQTYTNKCLCFYLSMLQFKWETLLEAECTGINCRHWYTRL